MDPAVDPLQRHLVVVGVDTESVQGRVVHRAGGEPAQHVKGDFGIGLAGKGGDLFRRQFGKTLRQIQTTVGSLTLEQGVAQAHLRGFAVGAVKE